MLFPPISVEFRNTIDGSGVSHDIPAATATSTQTVVATPPDQGSPLRERRAISGLEKEIKEVERRRASSPRFAVIGTGDQKWLTTLKRRLRRVDPDNPWAYDD